MKTISLSLIFVLLVSAQQATQPPAQATPAEGAQSEGPESNKQGPAVVAADSPPAIPNATSLATPVSSR